MAREAIKTTNADRRLRERIESWADTLPFAVSQGGLRERYDVGITDSSMPLAKLWPASREQHHHTSGGQSGAMALRSHPFT